jgi:hypothetical protein
MFENKSIQSFWSKVIKRGPTQCWGFNSCKDRDGYHKFSYKWLGETKYRQMGAHKMMIILHTGKGVPNGMVVMHSCDNPSCVNPAHLSVGTVQDNNLDKLLKGRAVAPKGERQASASITDDIARKIKAEAVVGYRSGYNNGSNLKEVAIKYGVKVELVRRIARGELYKHI